MDDNKKNLIKKILDRLIERKEEHEELSIKIGEIFSNFKSEKIFNNDENFKKISELTPDRPNDELITINHEGIDFNIKIWYDENYEVIFKIAEAELSKLTDFEKLDRIDEILKGLFKIDLFKDDDVNNLKRLMERFILEENYEEAKKIKLIMLKKEIEKENLENFKLLIGEIYEEILDNDNFKIDDNIVKKIETLIKKVKKNRKV
jgi:hypothetical protein